MALELPNRSRLGDVAPGALVFTLLMASFGTACVVLASGAVDASDRPQSISIGDILSVEFDPSEPVRSYTLDVAGATQLNFSLTNAEGARVGMRAELVVDYQHVPTGTSWSSLRAFELGPSPGFQEGTMLATLRIFSAATLRLDVYLFQANAALLGGEKPTATLQVVKDSGFKSDPAENNATTMEMDHYSNMGRYCRPIALDRAGWYEFKFNDTDRAGTGRAVLVDPDPSSAGGASTLGVFGVGLGVPAHGVVLSLEDDYQPTDPASHAPSVAYAYLDAKTYYLVNQETSGTYHLEWRAVDLPTLRVGRTTTFLASPSVAPFTSMGLVQAFSLEGVEPDQLYDVVVPEFPGYNVSVALGSSASAAALEVAGFNHHQSVPIAHWVTKPSELAERGSFVALSSQSSWYIDGKGVRGPIQFLGSQRVVEFNASGATYERVQWSSGTLPGVSLDHLPLLLFVENYSGPFESANLSVSVDRAAVGLRSLPEGPVTFNHAFNETTSDQGVYRISNLAGSKFSAVVSEVEEATTVVSLDLVTSWHDADSGLFPSDYGFFLENATGFGGQLPAGARATAELVVTNDSYLDPATGNPRTWEFAVLSDVAWLVLTFEHNETDDDNRTSFTAEFSRQPATPAGTPFVLDGTNRTLHVVSAKLEEGVEVLLEAPYGTTDDGAVDVHLVATDGTAAATGDTKLQLRVGEPVKLAGTGQDAFIVVSEPSLSPGVPTAGVFVIHANNPEKFTFLEQLTSPGAFTLAIVVGAAAALSSALLAKKKWGF
ncbi:MAG: hypothetical protein Kow0069_02730 [Promethearchaeota archaeon]